MKALFTKIAEVSKRIASACKTAALATASVCKKAAVTSVALLKKLDTTSKIAISVLLIVGVSTTAVSTTLAKYSQTTDNDIAIAPKSFYFESNLLKNSNEVYNVYSDTITFDLMNYPDNERLSEVNIAYTVTITSPDGGSLGTGTNTSGELKCKANEKDENYINSKATVSYSGLTQGKNYTITATSSGSYSKAISAKFYIVPGNYNLTATVENKVDYVLLTFSTVDYMGEVTITWQSGYVPDNSEPIMTSATGTSHTTTVTSNTTYTIKFYKTGNATYNASAFTVSK